MATEEQYFEEWALMFKSFVMQKAPYLVNEYTLVGNRDERGCMIPCFVLSDTLIENSKQKEEMAILWREFLVSNPY